MWFDRMTIDLPGTFKGSAIIAAVEIVTTAAKLGYHLQQRPDGNFDVGQRSGYSFEQFRVGGPTASIYDEPSIDPEADYRTIAIDNDPWSEDGFGGGGPAGDEMMVFVNALLGQLGESASEE